MCVHPLLWLMLLLLLLERSGRRGRWSRSSRSSRRGLLRRGLGLGLGRRLLGVPPTLELIIPCFALRLLLLLVKLHALLKETNR